MTLDKARGVPLLTGAYQRDRRTRSVDISRASKARPATPPRRGGRGDSPRKLTDIVPLPSSRADRGGDTQYDMTGVERIDC